MIVPFGEDALLVELGGAPGIDAARRAQALASAIRELRAGGVTVTMAGTAVREPVPGATSVLVPFDPLVADAASVRALLARALAGLPERDFESATARDHVLPVVYDGPDLAAVAAATGLRPSAVVDLHASTTYEVLFLGFAPGFAYLGEVAVPLRLPRLATPRVRVPAGSVAIAGPMTAVYPAASPGGWHLLGTTDAWLFDPHGIDPVRLRPGDRVRFEPR